LAIDDQTAPNTPSNHGVLCREAILFWLKKIPSARVWNAQRNEYPIQIPYIAKLDNHEMMQNAVSALTKFDQMLLFYSDMTAVLSELQTSKTEI
jgi:hypothetical protein